MYRTNALLGLLAILSALTLASSPALAASHVLQPPESTSEDVLAYQGFADTNFDDFPFGKVNFGDLLSAANTGPFGGHSVKSLVRFDVASTGLADSSLVTSATLRLYVTDASLFNFPISNPGPTTAVTVEVFSVTGAWTETDVTWNSLPTVAGGPALDSELVDGIGRWVELDVTSAVTNWIDTPASNLGLLLSSPVPVPIGKGAAGVVFYSSTTAAELNGESLKPQLVINAVPEPSTAALAMGGLATLALFGYRRLSRRPAGRAQDR